MQFADRIIEREKSLITTGALEDQTEGALISVLEDELLRKASDSILNKGMSYEEYLFQLYF